MARFTCFYLFSLLSLSACTGRFSYECKDASKCGSKTDGGSAAALSGSQATPGSSGSSADSGVIIPTPAAAPTVSRVYPEAVSLGGAVVTLEGSNFGSQTVVTIGGLPCTSLTAVSSTELSCRAPVQTGIGLKSIVAANSSYLSSSAPQMNYVLPDSVYTMPSAPVTSPDTNPVIGGNKGRLYIYGINSSPSVQSFLRVYSPGLNSWSYMDTTIGSMAIPQMSFLPNNILLWGAQAYGIEDPDVYRIDQNMNFETLSPDRITLPHQKLLSRTSFATTSVGQEQFRWGGVDRNFGTFLNDGLIGDPATFQWREINTQGAPTARKEAIAAWTGAATNKIIIWGGVDSEGNFLGNGKIYDVASDSWSSMAAENAPIGTRNSAFVWTGDSLLIFGGTIFNGQTYNGLSLYNLAKNEWSYFNCPGAVSASAVWTGTEALIMGGYTMGSGTNQLIRFTASTGCSSSTIPTAGYRHSHSAYWTGSQMIVWGGKTFQDMRLTDGWIFTP